LLTRVHVPTWAGLCRILDADFGEHLFHSNE
jgi:hypothetical protein